MKKDLSTSSSKGLTGCSQGTLQSGEKKALSLTLSHSSSAGEQEGVCASQFELLIPQSLEHLG